MRFDLPNEAVWLWDLKKKLLSFSEEWEHPFKNSCITVTYRDWIENIHSSDKDIFIKLEEKLTAEPGNKSNFPLKIRNSANRFVNFLFSAEITKTDSNGNTEMIRGNYMNISELKDTENYLRDINFRFGKLVENFRGGILLENEYRQIFYINKALLEFFRVDADPADLIGLDCTERAQEFKHLFVDPDLFISTTKKAIENRQPVYGQQFYLYSNIILERDYIPIFDNEIYKGHLWLYRNITNFKEIEKNLRYRFEFEKLITSLSVKFINLNWKQINNEIPGAIKSVGEFINADFGIVIISDSVNIFKVHFWEKEKSGNTGNPVIADTYVFNYLINDVFYDDSLKFVSVSDLPENIGEAVINFSGIKLKTIMGDRLQFNKEIIGIAGFGSCGNFGNLDSDSLQLLKTFSGLITNAVKREETEKALSKSEEQYRSVVNNIKEVIFQTDAEGLWTFLNPAWTEITGFSLEESIGVNFIDFVHPEDRERNRQLFIPLINRQKDYCRHEIRYLTKSGDYKWIEVFARLTLKDDEIIGTSGTLNNITDRKMAEKETEEALKSARELNELKSRFISMVSHEFRTPLAAILSTSELLDIYWDRWTEIDREKHFGKIKKSIKNLIDMLNDVSEINKAESGRIIVSPEILNVNNLLEEIIEELKATHKNHPAVHFTKSTGNPEIYTDHKLLRQIIINLVSNAMKYTPGSKNIFIDAQNDAAQFKLTVRDEGIGIPIEDQAHVFEPFTRSGNTDKIKGTGLGLSILKKAVELLEGEITFNSRINEGSEFLLKIPLNE